MPASTTCSHLATRSLSTSTHHLSALAAHHGNANTVLAAKTIVDSPGKPCSACHPPKWGGLWTLLRELQARTSLRYRALRVLVSRAQSAGPPTPCLHPSMPHLENTVEGVLSSTLSGDAVLALADGLLETLRTWASAARLSQRSLCLKSSQTTCVTLQLLCRTALQQSGLWQPDLS